MNADHAMRAHRALIERELQDLEALLLAVPLRRSFSPEAAICRLGHVFFR